MLLAGAGWGAALALAHRHLPAPGQLALLQCCVAAAVYGCVPETDQLKGVGLLVVGVLLLEQVAARRLPLGWHAIVTATIFWAAVYGATGRGSAVVGGLFAIWPIALVAITRRGTPFVSAAGVAAAWLVARTGGIQPTTAPAWFAVALWGGGSLLVVCTTIALTGRFRAGRPKLPLR